MKKVRLRLILISAMLIFAGGMFFTSCEKENSEISVNKEGSDMKADWLGDFRKELCVYDDSGENSIYLAVYSDDEIALDEFINNHSFGLNFDVEINSEENKSSIEDRGFEAGEGSHQEVIDPVIKIEYITQNFKNNENDYYALTTTYKGEKTTKSLMPIGYYKKGFIGIQMSPWGYSHLSQMRYMKHWYSSWKTVEDENGNNAFILDISMWINFTRAPWDYYKNAVVVIPDKRQNAINWQVYYEHDKFYSASCYIGYYTGKDCKYGTAPSGTTAFMYPNNTGNFYYTPVSGNQCPYSNSYFDGANCFVVDIPTTTYGFTYGNSWYTKPILNETY